MGVCSAHFQFIVSATYPAAIGNKKLAPPSHMRNIPTWRPRSWVKNWALSMLRGETEAHSGTYHVWYGLLDQRLGRSTKKAVKKTVCIPRTCAGGVGRPEVHSLFPLGSTRCLGAVVMKV
jgi:hypothetical protein